MNTKPRTSRTIPALLAAMALTVPAPAQDHAPRGRTLADEAMSGEKVSRYQPNQITRPIPKFEYSDAGRAITMRRHALYSTQSYPALLRFRHVDNPLGVEHVAKGFKLKREPQEVLSEDQKRILAKWGQPNYLRGPFKSTRGDSVVEWCYHPLNRIFQYVDRTMVFEGPLTDQDRALITHGAPKEAMVSQLEPDIRRETWIYRSGRFGADERVMSFANGKQIFSQETP